MPDKHEVGGSTPLEPTSRQCRQANMEGCGERSTQTDRRGERQRNLDARERTRKPERKKDAGNKTDMWIWRKPKTHNGNVKRMFIEN